MTAGTVVITGGILAAVILLTIITVLCYCRLQYFCCKREEPEGEGEGGEPDLAKSSQPPRPPAPPEYTPSSQACSQLLMTAGPYEPNGPAVYTPPLSHKPAHSHTFCPSYPGHLPFYLQQHDRLRNGGGRISYHTLQQRQELDLPVHLPSFHKLNLIRSVTMREVVTHHSVSTDV